MYVVDFHHDKMHHQRKHELLKNKDRELLHVQQNSFCSIIGDII